MARINVVSSTGHLRSPEIPGSDKVKQFFDAGRHDIAVIDLDAFNKEPCAVERVVEYIGNVLIGYTGFIFADRDYRHTASFVGAEGREQRAEGLKILTLCPLPHTLCCIIRLTL